MDRTKPRNRPVHNQEDHDTRTALDHLIRTCEKTGESLDDLLRAVPAPRRIHGGRR